MGRHALGQGHTDVGVAAYDVNGDGWIDLLSGSKLLLNPGQPRTAPFQAYDVDLDGDVDLFAKP